MKNKKVLGILPSKDFYGKERANIEVYNLLHNNGCSLRIVANKNADKRMIAEINKFKNYKLPFPNRWRTKFKYILYFYELFISNILQKSSLISPLEELPTSRNTTTASAAVA